MKIENMLNFFLNFFKLVFFLDLLMYLDSLFLEGNLGVADSLNFVYFSQSF